MRIHPVPFTLATLLCLATLSAPARAQGGCGQIPIDEGDIHCCDGTETQEDTSCGGSGNPLYFCSEGSGECCDVHYGLTFVTYDPQDCGGGCVPPSGGCPIGQDWNPTLCACVLQTSPIIIDTTGAGFSLTSEENGVLFDISGSGHPTRLAWTSPTSGNAFLALDRNHNGKIDSGKELFGNVTEQPPSLDPNGFLALAEFDKPENGGNGDGIIDERDAVFSHLLLWIDENHDGVSQPTELHTLPQLGVYSLALRYKESTRTDQFGNHFRYKAAVNPDPEDGESKDGRWMYDVFFVSAAGLGQAPRRFLRSNCNGRRDFRLLLDGRFDLESPDQSRFLRLSADKQVSPGGCK
ncbi:MAG TPA: hypothetical protein VKF84_05615 [Candidatus Sulfotelmatobacter sp.]|nr:hypothetical protein [Candidatus Sulfotelmatobacter sp.]